MTSTSSIAGHLEDHFSSNPTTQASFSPIFTKQSSALGSSQTTRTANNAKLGISYNNAGFSLPTSPSNFSSNLDAAFKPDNFVCSSPKQTRKGRNANQDDTDDFLTSDFIPHSQSSMNPGCKSKSPSVFDYDHTPSAYSSSSLFNFHENSGNHFKMNNSASHDLPDSIHQISHESNSSNKESFIAQVTRDLAKMSTVEKCLSEPASKLYCDSSFNLFKS